MAKSVNLDKVRRKLKEVKRRKAKRGIKWWKPEEGWNRIRILPPKKGDEFAKEYYVHRNLRKYPVPCPGDIGKKCLACELSQAGFKSRKPEDIEIAKRYSRYPQYLYSIVDMGGDKNKALVFRSGPQIYKHLLKYFANDDYGDMTDVNKGFDIKIYREGEDLQTTYTVQPAREPSKLKNAKSILKGAPMLEDLLEYPAEEDMQAMLEGEYDEDEEEDDEEEDEDDEEEEEEPKKKSKKKAEKSSKKKKDDDDEEDEDEDDEEDDDEEDDDEEDEDDDEEEDEDSDEDEDDDEDEEEEEKPKKEGKKKSKKSDDDEEEEDEEDDDDSDDDDDDEDEDEEEEEEEEEEEDDDEDDDDDEDEDEKPKKKSKKGELKKSKKEKASKKEKKKGKGKGKPDLKAALKRLRSK